MLKYVADKHSKKPLQIRDIKEQNILKETEEHKEVLETLEYDKFKCIKCLFFLKLMLDDIISAVSSWENQGT